MGILGLIIVALAPLVTLGALGFLLFMWFSHRDNATWRKIILHNWASRVVSISSFLIRSGCGFLSGFSACAIAALLLESHSAHLFSVPALSVFRNNASVWNLSLTLLRDIWTFKAVPSWFFYSLVTLLLMTTGLLNFTSTALLSDIAIGALPGPMVKQGLSYDFVLTSFNETWSTHQIPRMPAWNRNPSAYPIFAEYHEAALPQEDGMEDTGVLLRAFLPYSNASTREHLRTYEGKLAVLDARVICQRPDIRAFADYEEYTITGSFVNRFNTSQLSMTPHSVPFKCWLPTNDSLTYSICQLGYYDPAKPANYQLNQNAPFGGLFSAFSDLTADHLDEIGPEVNVSIHEVPWGPTYLVLKTGKRVSDGSNSSSYNPDGIWVNIEVPALSSTIVSVTACYTSWQFVDLDVVVSGGAVSTEPNVQYSHAVALNPYNQSQVISQLDFSLPTTSRGILSLEKKESWFPAASDAPPPGYNSYLLAFMEMSGIETGIPDVVLDFWNLVPYTAELSWGGDIAGGGLIFPDLALSAVFNQTAGETGSIAKAFSNLLTVLSTSVYYDQMVAFDKHTDAAAQFYVDASFPQSSKGLTAVIVVVAVHLLVNAWIIELYLMRSWYSLIGNTWMAVAQIMTPEMVGILEKSTDSTDGEVLPILEKSGKADRRMVIQRFGGKGGDRIGVDYI